MVTAAVRPLPLPDFILSSAVGRLLTDLFAKPLSSFTIVTLLLLVCELALNVLIVKKVPYTEIDWQAYVDEVEGVIVHGNFNYTELRGPTGPLVYPAGFVYTYSLLHWATDEGTNIARAQTIFIALYLATFAVVAGIYAKAAPKGFHPCWLGLLCLSKRVHSIFALRLFNDGPTMLFLYLAVLLFLHKRWTLGCTLFSFAFANKMNIILFSPALFILLVAETGPVGAIWRIVLCGAIQVVLGAPFLMHDAKGYLGASFNLGRTFKHHWSVNFRWVPCELLPPEEHTLLTDCDGLFTSKAFGLGLLLAMVVLMLAFAHFRWCERGLLSTLTTLPGTSAAFTENQAAAMLFACNFIGVVCARSLHFQFYVWYYHTLPFLLWSTRLPVVARLLLLLGIELAWNPWVGDSSTPASSALLTACHIVILLALWDGLATRSTGGAVSGGKAKAP